MNLVSAFEAKEIDVQNVLEQYSLRVTNTEGKSFETMACELINEIDMKRVATAVLDGENDINLQTIAAQEEIKKQLVNMGVLDF